MNEIVESHVFVAHNAVIIRGQEVWLTYDRPWWDVLEAIRWALTPGKESKVFLRVGGYKSRVEVRAKRISRTFVRLGGAL
jgi:hypothetical protein